MRMARPISTNRRRGQKGSSLLEGAFALMAFLAMTCGLVEASMAVYAYNTVAYGAGAAAREMSLHGSEARVTWVEEDVRTYVRTHSPGLLTNRLRTTPSWPLNPDGSWDKSHGGVATVRIEYDVVPLIHVVFGRTFTISSTSRMTIGTVSDEPVLN